jgi:hypothetical protein
MSYPQQPRGTPQGWPPQPPPPPKTAQSTTVTFVALLVVPLGACSGEAPDASPDAATLADAAPDALPPPLDATDAASDATPSWCPAPGVVCSGGCVDLTRDRMHCGGCGQVCGAELACSAGVCSAPLLPDVSASDAVEGGDAAADAPLVCPVGRADCDGNRLNGCEVDTNNAANCGGCGLVCGAAFVCIGSLCVAPDAAVDAVADAAGADARVAPDAPDMPDAPIENDARTCTSMTPSNCCGVACPIVASSTHTCVAGRCGFNCIAGLNDCDRVVSNGCESNSATDAMNCGACGNRCADGLPCYGGRCVASCPAGQTVCDSECTDTTRHRLHCGACGRGCSSTQVCAAGTCVAPCVAPRSFCGAICTDLRSDPNNCGSCGNACDGVHFCDNAGNCASCGAKVEGRTIVRCGNTCVDLFANDRNCGACGVVCTDGRFCFNGTCRR